MNDVTAFAYYFPGYHRNDVIFSEDLAGYSEWDLVKNATPFFPNHSQPKIPQWGYEDESAIPVLQKKLHTAREFCIDSLLFIGYWYLGGPVCMTPFENALSLAVKDPVHIPKPSLMWANHTRYYAYPEDPHVPTRPHLVVDYSPDHCEKMIEFWVEKYLSHPGYFRLKDGKPFFSIYSPQSFINSAGSSKYLEEFIICLRDKCSAHGIPAIHVHACEVRFIKDLEILSHGFDSCSDYLSLGYSENKVGKEPHLDLPSLHGQLRVTLSFKERLENIKSTFYKMRQLCPIPYSPVVTTGRDCSPRVKCVAENREGHYSARPIITDMSADSFREQLGVAKRFINETNTIPHIFINAWNEWTEGAYLEPDEQHGFTFLEVIRSELGK